MGCQDTSNWLEPNDCTLRIDVLLERELGRDVPIVGEQEESQCLLHACIDPTQVDLSSIQTHQGLLYLGKYLEVNGLCLVDQNLKILIKRLWLHTREGEEKFCVLIRWNREECAVQG